MAYTVQTVAGQLQFDSEIVGGVHRPISANSPEILTALQNILTDLQLKADKGETQPVSVATLPLPTGAATASNQGTANVHLADISTNTSYTYASGGSAVGGRAAIQAYVASGNVVRHVGDSYPMPVRVDELPGTVESDIDAIHTLLESGNIDVTVTATPDTAVLNSILVELQAKADLGETQPVSVVTLPLPTGAATATNQLAIDTTLSSILVELQAKADLGETQPVSAASLPLPTGAATSANQTTGNNSLASILAELQAKADLGETQPVIIKDGANEVTVNASGRLEVAIMEGASTATEYIEGDSEVSLVGPTVLGRDGSNVVRPLLVTSAGKLEVEAGTLPLPTGASTSANQTTINASLGSILTELQAKADLSETQPVSAASLPLPTGAATAANQLTANTSLSSLLTELEKKADLTETQPVSVQDLPLAGSEVAFESKVTVTDSATQIVASNSSRKAVMIVNNGTNDVWISTSDTPTAGEAGTNFARLEQDDVAILQITNRVYGITASGTSGVGVVEIG